MNSLVSEKYYRLKYFYLIDINKCINTIKKSEIYQKYNPAKTDDIASLFQYIFSEMITASGDYFNYLQVNHYYFSRDALDPYTNCLYYLCEVSLFHHCLIHGFISSTNYDSVSKYCLFDEKSSFIYKANNSSKKEMIKLSATTEDDILSGYLKSSPILTKQDNFSDKRYATYNSMYHRFWEYDASCNPNQNTISKATAISKEELYSKKILKYNYFPGETLSAKSSQAIEVEKIYSNAVLYLLRECPAARKLDRSINKNNTSSKIIQNYNALIKETKDWKKNNSLSQMDTILFDAYVEKIYGIYLYSSIHPLINQISSNTSNIASDHENSSGKYDLTILNSQGLWSTIRHYVSLLPITYNRALFLECACRATINTKYPKIEKPDKGTTIIGTRDTSLNYEDKYLSTALVLIGNYFRRLLYITLPILEDLWDVIINELNIDFRHYQSYIKKYYKLINYNYLSVEPEKFRIYSNDFLSIYKTLTEYMENIDGYCEPVELIINNKQAEEIMAYLFSTSFNLKHYEQQLKKNRFQFTDDLFSHSKSFSSRDSFSTHRIDFWNIHYKNIWDYIEHYCELNQ